MRQRTEARIESWHGETPGLSRSWVEEHVTGLTESKQAAIRLTLLTALAPYQVDAKIVNAFRQYYPDDQDLIVAAAWASFAATRRVGSWLKLPNNL